MKLILSHPLIKLFSIQKISNLGVMEQVYLKAILDILDSHAGPKNLIVDPDLVNSINLIVQIQTLNEHKVVHVGPLRNHNRQPILTFYLIKNSAIETTLHILDKSCQNIILLVPRIDLNTQLKLEQTGLKYQSIPLFWSLVDSDLLSLELNCFRDLFVFKNSGVLYDMSRGLIQLISCYGKINRIVAKGNYSVELKDLLLKMTEIDSISRDNQSEDILPSNLLPSNQFFPLNTYEPPVNDAILKNVDVFMFDRSVDQTSPLLKQLTYNGLLSEYCNYECGHIDDNNSMYNAQNPTTSSKKIKLKDDNVYQDIKDANFVSVGSILHKTSKSLREIEESRHQATTIGQLKTFVSSKLGSNEMNKKSLALHTNITEQLKKVIEDDDFEKMIEIQQACFSGNESLQHLEFVEELINRSELVDDLLRILCYISILCDGIKQRQFEYFKKEIVSSFGIMYFEIIDDLNTAQLLVKKEDGLKSTYRLQRKQLKLYMDNTNEKDPTDISYVYSGIAPLIPRLMEILMQNQLNIQAIQSVPGVQEEYAAGNENGEIVIIVIVGGITHAEIASLRFIFKDRLTKVLIASTNITTPDFYRR
eukprot:NODE_131_length_18300_cov_0.442668.p2 type:complete len:590 gc:universal NODE_131_length_18300_cov_0.442668:1973-3742(+)